MKTPSSTASRRRGLLPALALLSVVPLAFVSGSPGAIPRGTPFLTSTECATCHSNASGATAMRDAQSRPIAPFDLWQSSMMANSARDPFWRAAVAAERTVTPARSSEIAAKCTRCHTPMASVDGHGDTEYAMSPDKLDGNDSIAALGRDGVSCTVCHQIRPDNLGTPESYSGHYEIEDNGDVFGPHQNLQGGPMINMTGKNPVTASHLAEDSGLCATCHTLFTNTVRPDGVATGDVHAEQTPYLEWRNSDYQDETLPVGSMAASCQACHLPQVDADGNPINARVARNPAGFDWPWLAQRQPYGRHLLVGGNTLVPAILRDNAAALGVTAPATAFDATIAAARNQLQTSTGRVSFQGVSRNGGDLDVTVRVENLAGHKFPTGYPSRRAWVRLEVRDASGRVVWDCGGFDARGRLLGSGGAVLPAEQAGGPVLPHRDLVTSADAPQVYESVMADENGAPTFRLMQAATFLKDDRLLPDGWSATHPDAPDTQPYGLNGDADFVGGRDDLTFRVPAPAAAGPYSVTATLHYQVIAPRYVDEMFQIQHPDIRRFEAMYAAADPRPEIVATASTTAN